MISLLVTDVFSDAAVQNATVVIPETGAVLSTDAAGRTDTAVVPILPDERFSSILAQPFGNVTVLVYADGYYPLALFYVTVAPDAFREAVPVHLFPNDGTLETALTMIESPDRAWSAALIEKYRPD